MTQALLLTGVRLLDAAGERAGWLRVDGGRIAALGADDAPASARAGAEVLAGADGRLTPAFVDLHLHGGGGASVGEPGAVPAVLAAHRDGGTGIAVLSLVSAPLAELEGTLEALRPHVEADPRIAGVHLEGPFLSPARAGAHDVSALIDPDPAAVQRLLGAGMGILRRITLAPELPGALDAIEALAGAGVEVSVGHTEADYATVREAFARGARSLTHAFNAMPGITGRAPGPVAAAIDDGSA
ncbi:MAG TPA: amidohydrolase family protein, partial [Naasia sp.]